VEPDGRSGAENMAIDEALLHRGGANMAFLRLYRWTPPCLSFGRNEPARTRYDREIIARLGLDTVRRPTGGRTVWHNDELTYSVIGPVGLFGSLRETYRAIHLMLAAALRRLGAPVTMAAISRRGVGHLGSGACFASGVDGEIVSGGRKLVGSAQVREGGAFLQHGSILLSDDQNVVAQVTQGPADAPRATSLASLLNRPVAFREVAEAVAGEAQRAWAGDWRVHREPLPAGSSAARFRDPDWTWRR
jgi:lipoate-protein ligase A